MKKEIIIEHVSAEMKNSFDRFTFQLEKALGVLSPGSLKRLGAAPASMTRYLNDTRGENELVLFNILLQEDLSDQVNGRKIKQYQVGNPVVMHRMISRQAATGLYIPIQLLVYEKPGGEVMVEYDLPSSIFGTFNDPEINSDAMLLEHNLVNLIRVADKKTNEDE